MIRSMLRKNPEHRPSVSIALLTLLCASWIFAILFNEETLHKILIYTCYVAVFNNYHSFLCPNCRLLNSLGIHTCSLIFSNVAYKLHYSVHLQRQQLKQSCPSQRILRYRKADQCPKNHLHQLLLLCPSMWTPALTERAVLPMVRVVPIGKRSMEI